jgi:hypothetical protein
MIFLPFLAEYHILETTKKAAAQKTKLDSTSRPMSQVTNSSHWPGARPHTRNFGTVSKFIGILEITHQLLICIRRAFQQNGYSFLFFVVFLSQTFVISVSIKEIWL